MSITSRRKAVSAILLLPPSALIWLEKRI